MDERARARQLRKRRPYPSQKYGASHRALRARLAPVVAAGTVRCARCDELITPQDKWELDHRDDGKGWLGPSHRSCNRSAGWEKMVTTTATAGSSTSSPTNGRAGGLRNRPWAPRYFSATARSKSTSGAAYGRPWRRDLCH